jgi:penicillin-binding protein 1B
MRVPGQAPDARARRGGAFLAAMKRAFKIALFTVLAALLFSLPPTIYSFISYYNALENEVVTRFSGKRWDIPSRIYSDSCFVYPGQSLDDLGFFQRLARLNYHRVAPGQVASRGEYSLDEKKHRLIVFLHDFAYPYSNFAGAAVEMTLGPHNMVTAMRDPLGGKALYSAELEPELISGIFQGSWQQRRLVPLAQIPPAFIDAILAAEDHRFYEHHGVDLIRIVKAAWVDFSARRVRQGGSTLTQQLMKNFFLTSKRDWHRKVKEILMAYIAERQYSKDQILENYINDIYLGQRGQEGIYGVWEASEYYFSKEPKSLTIGEMATIAGMISSPNRLNPLHHPQLAQQRRNEVLGLMLADGYISKPAFDSAATEPLHPRETFVENNDAPYFVDYVKRELAERYPPNVLTGEGLRIFTSLDVHAQKLAEKAVRDNLDYLERRHASLRRKEKKDQLEEALIAIEPQSGKIRVMVGGRDYRESQFDRITQAKRQPGSAFKPITYLAAMQETLEGGPEHFLPTTYIDDTPFTWTYGDMSWSPKNYKDRYFGRVTLEFALEESLNSATSRLANQIGLDQVRAMAQKMGFGNLPSYPSIVLGGIEVTPMQIAQAYSIMADYGLEVQSYAVTAVVDQSGKVIEGHELQASQVLSPQLAYMIDFMLEQVINHGTGEGARKRGFTRPAAGKTGTTNDSKDAWFTGFTPNLLAVVWTGFDQKEELGLTGAEASLPAWTDFMKAATASRPPLDFAPPPGIVVEKVDPLTGYLAGPNCPVVLEGAFPTALAPTQVCPLHSAGGATPASVNSPPGGAAGSNWERVPSDPND